MDRPRLEVLQHTGPQDELGTFAAFYLGNLPELHMKPPVDDAIDIVEGLHGIVLWREGRFQVQLFICAPGVKIPPHAHPTVDSYEVHLNGGVDFVVAGRRTIPQRVLARKQGDASAWYGWAVRVRPGVEHQAEIGPQGGAFLSIQQWPEGARISSVGHDWDGGQTMGERHERQLAR